jgi:hypothetical protein
MSAKGLKRGSQGLRISFSAFSGLAAVMLVVLWLRSNAVVDAVIVPVSPTCTCGIGTAYGTVIVSLANTSEHLQLVQEPIDEWAASQRTAGWPIPSPLWGAFVKDDVVRAIAVPDWFVLAITIGVGALPWTSFKLQFSLCTILLTTTLAAATLALVV